jgi:GT2 family glycosyltransferase
MPKSETEHTTLRPLVAIVILNYNGRGYLQRFLPSVMASTWPNLQIVVADNDSTDDSIAFIRAEYPSIRIIRNPTNEGFARGYNTALRQVEADVFVLLNSDVEVTPGWIEPVIELMESDLSIAACQPKILDWNRREKFEYAGAAGGWLDTFGYPFCRGRVFDVCEEDHGQYDRIRPIFWASGAAMFIRSEVFLREGGFDPFFFAHQEEIDLCWRIQASGMRIMACPASVVYHVGGGTLPQGNPRKTFLNFRNNLIMLWKNMGTAEKSWKIPVRFALDALSAWKNLLSGNPAYFMAVSRAHLAFFQWVLSPDPESLFPRQKARTTAGIWRGNIIWQHFVRRKSAFSEIVGPDA